MNALRKIAFLFAVGTVGTISLVAISNEFSQSVQSFFGLGSNSENEEAQNLKSVAKFLETDRRTFINKPERPDKAAESTAPRLPFAPDWIDSIESEEIKNRLANIGKEDPKSLVEDINNLIIQTDISRIDEKQRLIQVSNYFESTHHVGLSKEVFLQEADHYIDSEDPAVAGYGRRALEYALALEPNKDIQRDERDQFYTRHPQNFLQSEDKVSEMSFTEQGRFEDQPQEIQVQTPNDNAQTTEETNRLPADEVQTAQ